VPEVTEEAVEEAVNAAAEDELATVAEVETVVVKVEAGVVEAATVDEATAVVVVTVTVAVAVELEVDVDVDATAVVWGLETFKSLGSR
jgi:hypothetical protein